MLQEILALCNNRYVLFDNKTKDERKRLKQVEQLLSLVNKVVAQNGGKPYMDELFTELKVNVSANFCLTSLLWIYYFSAFTTWLQEGAIKLHNQQIEADAMKGYTKRQIKEMKEHMHQTYDEQLKRITEMVPFWVLGPLTYFSLSFIVFAIIIIMHSVFLRITTIYKLTLLSLKWLSYACKFCKH